MKHKQTLVYLTTLSVFLVAFAITSQTAAQAITHPQGHFVTVNGSKLWYETEGKGEPLLLIGGGLGYSHVYLHPHFSTLADKYRVIYFDAYGRGNSDRAQSPKEYTFKRDVEDIDGLRKALGITTWHVLGHSYGGLVAQAYALKFPTSVKKLILANTLFSAEMWQANNDNANNEIRNQYPEVWQKIRQLRAKGLHSSAPEHQEAYNVPLGLFYFYDASNAEKLAGDSLMWNPEVYYTIVGDDADFLVGGDIARLDFRPRLKELKMPTLILAGRFDRICLPRYSIQFKTYAPQAEFFMFEKSGHFPFIEEPQNTFEVIRKFLDKSP